MYSMLAFAGGVMLSISFLQLIPESIKFSSVITCAAGIVIGSIVMFIVDRLIPHIHPELCGQEQGCHLKKTATYLLFGIFMHNIPEGMAIGLGLVTKFGTGLAIALAIAVHDIPEGIVTAAPYYFCTKKRLKSFLVSASTGLATILGYFIALLTFPIISGDAISLVVGATAGLMIYISCDELIPTSCSKGAMWSHASIFSLIAGVIFALLITSVEF
jgi:ZIP family zinc transporter